MGNEPPSETSSSPRMHSPLPISFLGRGTLDIADHPTAVDQADNDSQDYYGDSSYDGASAGMGAAAVLSIVLHESLLCKFDYTLLLRRCAAECFL